MSGDPDPPHGGKNQITNIDQSEPPPQVAGQGSGASSTSGGSGGAGGPGGGTLGTAIGVQAYPMERTRARIAYFLLWIMVGVILAVVLVSLMFSVDCWLRANRCAPAKDALAMLTGGISPVFTALVGLVGSVVGFYFGSREA